MSPADLEVLPHQFPFRLVERSEAIGTSTVAISLASAGDFLTRISPWPVTLVAEALAQAILLVERPQQPRALRLVGLDAVSLKQPVQAGDRLEVEICELGTFGALRRYACRATRAGALAACAEVTVTS